MSSSSLYGELLKVYESFCHLTVDYSDDPSTNKALTFEELLRFIDQYQCISHLSLDDQDSFLDSLEPPVGRLITWTDFRIILDLAAGQQYPKKAPADAIFALIRSIVRQSQGKEASVGSVGLKKRKPPVAPSQVVKGNKTATTTAMTFLPEQQSSAMHGIVVSSSRARHATVPDSLRDEPQQQQNRTPSESPTDDVVPSESSGSGNERDETEVEVVEYPEEGGERSVSNQMATESTAHSVAVSSSALSSVVSSTAEGSATRRGGAATGEGSKNKRMIYIPTGIEKVYVALMQCIRRVGVQKTKTLLSLPQRVRFFSHPDTPQKGGDGGRSKGVSEEEELNNSALPFPLNPTQLWLDSFPLIGKELFPHSNSDLAVQELGFQYFLNRLSLLEGASIE